MAGARYEVMFRPNIRLEMELGKGVAMGLGTGLGGG